ncbi:crossover junction endodeoxyribonuclease RuvC [Amnibacterium flavum]|uniref:Crossover junction endodeoxyribonuclease RuvC n=1 Tax=Amnibacterium flavum TaxID=2173173 RepID=A0A2V1HVG1_9MICO|nr:crossover junction endodeoxyribonuclease RuvC [Amnibacterium flavum]PVZ94337.1 crossover junction endodeoxyribonuclease RuvC [Amnibacterium flavum]
MALRVLGIDPGLTRCGYGVIDVEPGRRARLVTVGVVRTELDLPVEQRVHGVAVGLERVLDEFTPEVVALERVFAQQNLSTVMGTAQASGVVMYLSAARGLPVTLHTPSEVKAAVTGYGSADKKQVANMVARVLGLDSPPTPADAADALALAICHAWRGPARVAPVAGAGGAALTPAQRAWAEAERASRR